MSVVQTNVVLTKTKVSEEIYDDRVDWWNGMALASSLGRVIGKGVGAPIELAGVMASTIGWILQNPFRSAGIWLGGYLETWFVLPFQLVWELVSSLRRNPLIVFALLGVAFYTSTLLVLFTWAEIQLRLNQLFGAGHVFLVAVPHIADDGSEFYTYLTSGIWLWGLLWESLQRSMIYVHVMVFSEEQIRGLRYVGCIVIISFFASMRAWVRLFSEAYKRSQVVEVHSKVGVTTRLVFDFENAGLQKVGDNRYEIVAVDSTGAYSMVVKPTTEQRVVNLLIGRHLECAQPGSFVEPIGKIWDHEIAWTTIEGVPQGHGFRYKDGVCTPRHVWDKIKEREDLVVVGSHLKAYPFRSKDWDVQVESMDGGGDFVFVIPPAPVFTECGIRAAQLVKSPLEAAVEIRRLGFGYRSERSAGMYHPLSRDYELFDNHDATTTWSVSGAPLTDSKGRVYAMHCGFEGSQNFAFPARLISFLVDPQLETYSSINDERGNVEDDDQGGDVPEEAAEFRTKGRKGGKSGSVYLARKAQRYSYRANQVRVKAFSRRGHKKYEAGLAAKVEAARSEEIPTDMDFKPASHARARPVETGNVGGSSSKPVSAKAEIPEPSNVKVSVSPGEAITADTGRTPSPAQSKSALRREKRKASKAVKASLSHRATLKPKGEVSGAIAGSQ